MSTSQLLDFGKPNKTKEAQILDPNFLEQRTVLSVSSLAGTLLNQFEKRKAFVSFFHTFCFSSSEKPWLVKWPCRGLTQLPHSTEHSSRLAILLWNM